MNRNLTRLAVFVVTVLVAGQAGAWRSFNRFGGSTEHMAGVGTEHTNAWGGSTEHAFGGGTEHTNVYGGSTEGRYGEGAEHTNVYGGTTEASWGGAYHTTPTGVTYGATAYPAPVAVPYYSAAGCYGCAAAAGAIVGATAGAAAASASAASAVSATYVMGTNYATLPAGCAKNNVNGSTYYLCGSAWFQPSYGSNGVYYQVVANPW